MSSFYIIIRNFIHLVNARGCKSKIWSCGNLGQFSPRLSDKMQNKANTLSVSNFAMKITLKNGHVMTYPKYIVTQNLYQVACELSRMFLLLYSFFNQFTVYKVHRRFGNRNFPFRERTNYTLDIKEQNYASYQYKRCNVATCFWRQTDVARKTS